MTKKMSLDISDLMDEIKEGIESANADITRLADVRPASGKKREEELMVLAAAIAKVIINHIRENADVIIDPHDNATALDPGGTAPNRHPVQVSRQKGYIR